MAEQPSTPRASRGALIQRSEVSVWSGALPRPEDLTKFNEAFPTCAEEIVELAKRQAAHRQNLETKVVDANIKADTRGQKMGFVIAIVVLIGGIGLMAIDKPISGGVLVGGDLAGLVGLFVYGKEKQRRELKQKREEVQHPPWEKGG